MGLNGIYVGIVEKVGDPEKLGRLKVRVPGVYGIQGSAVGAIPVDDLPWALPMGLPAGGSNDSGGLSMLPEVGDQVAVQFLDEEPEKPVWQWLMQTQGQAKKLKLHQYTAKQESGQSVAGTAARAILTRYGHSLEIRPELLALTTAEGQQVLLETSKSAAGGAATLQTPKGQSIKANDNTESIIIQGLKALVNSAKSLIFNAPTSALVKTQRLTVMAGTSMIVVQGNTILVTTQSGASVIIDDSGNISVNAAGGAAMSLDQKVQIGSADGTGIVIEKGQISVNAPKLVVNTASCSVGTSVGFPVVVMSPSLAAWLMTHTHSNGNDGAPTGPPIPKDPTFPLSAVSTRLQSS